MNLIDEAHITHCAARYRYAMVLISHAKKSLASECPADFRLKVLRYFEKFSDQWLDAEMIALIEPMCVDGEKLFMETCKLGYKPPDGAFDVMARSDVFCAFASLNPSLLAAIKYANAKRGLTDDAMRKLYAPKAPLTFPDLPTPGWSGLNV